MADDGKGHIDDPLGEPAGIHDLAREHEEGDGHQGKAVRPVDEIHGDDLGVHQVHIEHHGKAAGDQGDGDRHSDRHRPQQ